MAAGVSDTESSVVSSIDNEDGTNTIVIDVKDEFGNIITGEDMDSIEFKFDTDLGESITGTDYNTLTAINDDAYFSVVFTDNDDGTYTIVITHADYTGTVDVRVDGVEIETEVDFVITNVISSF